MTTVATLLDADLAVAAADMQAVMDFETELANVSILLEEISFLCGIFSEWMIFNSPETMATEIK